MSTSIALQVKPLDEAAWQAWVAKGRAQDRRSRAGFVRGMKCASIVALLAAAGLWTYFAPYEVAARFIVTAGALIVMFQALHERRYAVAAVFGALTLIYNPLVEVFRFSGNGMRAAVAASAIPFAVSLAWGNKKREHND